MTTRHAAYALVWVLLIGYLIDRQRLPRAPRDFD